MARARTKKSTPHKKTTHKRPPARHEETQLELTGHEFLEWAVGECGTKLPEGTAASYFDLRVWFDKLTKDPRDQVARGRWLSGLLSTAKCLKYESRRGLWWHAEGCKEFALLKARLKVHQARLRAQTPLEAPAPASPQTQAPPPLALQPNDPAQFICHDWHDPGAHVEPLTSEVCGDVHTPHSSMTYDDEDQRAADQALYCVPADNQESSSLCASSEDWGDVHTPHSSSTSNLAHQWPPALLTDQEFSRVPAGNPGFSSCCASSVDWGDVHTPRSSITYEEEYQRAADQALYCAPAGNPGFSSLCASSGDWGDVHALHAFPTSNLHDQRVTALQIHPEVYYVPAGNAGSLVLYDGSEDRGDMYTPHSLSTCKLGDQEVVSVQTDQEVAFYSAPAGNQGPTSSVYTGSGHPHQWP